MSANAPQHPLEILRDFEHRARASVVGYPEQKEARQVWLGIGFKIAGERLALSTREISELLNYPRVHRVPGTRAWVRGLANIRGRIMTVIDLAGFLMGESTVVRPRSRILAVKDEAMQAGFLVDDVFGLKHFFEDEFIPETEGFAAWMRPFLKGRVDDQEHAWGLMDLKAVLNSPDLMQAGL